MLLCVVIVFFLCNILAFVVNVLEMFGIEIAFLTMINNLLVTVNSSVNFLIYCIFGQKFRKLFFQIFCHNVRHNIESTKSMNGNTTIDESRTNTTLIRMSTWNRSQSRKTSQIGSAPLYKSIPLKENEEETTQ